jgi:hypothetical protein
MHLAARAATDPKPFYDVTEKTFPQMARMNAD